MLVLKPVEDIDDRLAVRNGPQDGGLPDFVGHLAHALEVGGHARALLVGQVVQGSDDGLGGHPLVRSPIDPVAQVHAAGIEILLQRPCRRDA